MKKHLYSIALGIFLLHGNASATLIDRGNGLIYDDVQDVTWIQDANYAQTVGAGDYGVGAMSTVAAVDWTADLEYAGITGWRIPTAYANDGITVGMNYEDAVKESEMGYLYWTYGVNYSNQGPFSNMGFWNPPTGGSFAYLTSTAHPNSGHYMLWLNTQGGQVVDGESGYFMILHDGDVGNVAPEPATVTTTQTFTTDLITLGDTFTFDYFWEMGTEPTNGNFDVLFFNGTEWETFGWQLNLGGSSVDWASASFYVPVWARGEDVQIKFSLFDGGQDTDPTVYLRNIASNSSAPVPEPATMLLFGTGLAGLAAVGRIRKKA